jgi:hypothetical protein
LKQSDQNASDDALRLCSKNSRQLVIGCPHGVGPTSKTNSLIEDSCLFIESTFHVHDDSRPAISDFLAFSLVTSLIVPSMAEVLPRPLPLAAVNNKYKLT